MTRLLLLLLALASLSLSAQELLQNSGFALAPDGSLTAWQTDLCKPQTVTDGLPEGVSHAIAATIAKAHKTHGYIRQKLTVQPLTQYRFSCWMRAPEAAGAYLQVMIYPPEGRARRVTSANAGSQWQRGELTFFSSDSTTVVVLCRFIANQETIGMTPEFADPQLTPITADPAERCRVVIAGDSTVMTYNPDGPRRGWGQMIGEFLKPGVVVHNHAMGGRSTKTFILEKRWKAALAELRKGDYLLLQFGHNDSHGKDRPESTDPQTDYRDYLRTYADDALAKGAHVVFITPMHRRVFHDGKLATRLQPYADAMKAVAAEKKVPCVDLYSLSGELMQKLGEDACTPLMVNETDRSHFCEKGARTMARLIVGDIRRQQLPLAAELVADPH